MKDNICHLIKDTKRFLLSLDTSFVFLDENEKKYFQNDITQANKAKKPIKKIEIKEPPTKASSPIFHPAAKRFLQKEKPLIKKDLPPIPTMPASIIEKKTYPTTFIPKIQREEKSSKSKFITLEKPKKAELFLDDIRRIVEEIAPHFETTTSILDDKKARQIAKSYKLKKTASDITILSFKETPQGFLFLRNLETALDTLFFPTKIINAFNIEKENAWDMFLSQEDLKLIIACDYSIWGLPNLIKYYRENPALKSHMLKNTPLFMLPDISLYLKEPLLKKSLFASLCKTLSAVKSS